MSDWRERMKHLFRSAAPRKPVVSMEEGRERIERFIDQTVVTAFEELATELRGHGREVTIDRQPFMAVLTVFHAGREEYSYAVRGRAYHRFNFAFPELGKEKEPRFLRAEVVQSSGEGPHDELEHFTREGIIEDFLAEYSKWMGWA